MIVGLVAKAAIQKNINSGMVSDGLNCNGSGTLRAPGLCQHCVLIVAYQFHQISFSILQMAKMGIKMWNAQTALKILNTILKSPVDLL